MSESRFNKTYAEYSFEYSVEKVAGSMPTPKLAFMRDVLTDDAVYSLYALFDCSPGQGEEGPRFDRADVCYDLKGISCTKLADRTSAEYASAEIKLSVSLEEYLRSGRLVVFSAADKDFSGIGVMEFFKGEELVARFFFSVNFIFRKKISYSLSVHGNSGVAKFTCHGRPVQIDVGIAALPDRLPCLKNDTWSNMVDKFELDFSKRRTFTRKFKAREDLIYTAFIADPSDESFYMLDCKKNDSYKAANDRRLTSMPAATCPFCHKVIDAGVKNSAEYRLGGAACDKQARGFAAKLLPVVVSAAGKAEKKCMYCEQDLFRDENGHVLMSEGKLLPSGYLDRDTFKIVIVGPEGAGKDTYLARLFGLKYKDGAAIFEEDSMALKCLKRFGIDVSVARIEMLEDDPVTLPGSVAGRNVDVVCYEKTGKDRRESDDAFVAVAEAVSKGLPCVPTGASRPYVLGVGNRAYVGFYALDCKNKDDLIRELGEISQGMPIGVICMLDPDGSSEACESVLAAVAAANIHRDSRIAVVLGKFDKYADKFDGNCQALRTDHYDNGFKTRGSDLERNMNVASEEIKSFLKFSEIRTAAVDGKFKHVKYFGLSSYAQSQRVEGGSYMSSPMRAELPVLYMLCGIGVSE